MLPKTVPRAWQLVSSLEMQQPSVGGVRTPSTRKYDNTTERGVSRLSAQKCNHGGHRRRDPLPTEALSRSGTIRVKRDPLFLGETIAPCPPIVVILPVYVTSSVVVVLLVFLSMLYSLPCLPCGIVSPGVLCCVVGRLIRML